MRQEKDSWRYLKNTWKITETCFHSTTYMMSSTTGSTFELHYIVLAVGKGLAPEKCLFSFSRNAYQYDVSSVKLNIRVCYTYPYVCSTEETFLLDFLVILKHSLQNY